MPLQSGNFYAKSHKTILHMFFVSHLSDDTDRGANKNCEILYVSSSCVDIRLMKHLLQLIKIKRSKRAEFIVHIGYMYKDN
jgi:hypothetical protein